MKNIQIRNVPERTHAVLRQRASESGMSLQEYVLDLLRESTKRPTVTEVIRRAGERAGGRLSLSTSASEVRRERERR